MLLATQLHITRRPKNYVSEFNPRCEKRSSNGPCEMLRKMLNRCSEEGSQHRRPLFSGYHGIGWVSPRRSFWLRSSAGTYCLDCNDLEPINSWPRSSSPVMCVR